MAPKAESVGAMTVEKDLYHYRATIKSVYDADTIRVDWDLGAGILLKNEPLRLYGINAPEMRGDEREQGLISRDALRAKIPAGAEVIIKTVQDKKGKYGRYLAEIYLDDLNINKWLVDDGYAVYKDYS